MIDTRHFLKKKKIKKEYARNWSQNIFEEDKQKIKEYGKQCRKNQSNSALQKLKESNKLKSVEVDVATNIIKNEVESSSMLKFVFMMMMTLFWSLDLDKICVAFSKILVACNGASWDMINPP